MSNDNERGRRRTRPTGSVGDKLLEDNPPVVNPEGQALLAAAQAERAAARARTAALLEEPPLVTPEPVPSGEMTQAPEITEPAPAAPQQQERRARTPRVQPQQAAPQAEQEAAPVPQRRERTVHPARQNAEQTQTAPGTASETASAQPEQRASRAERQTPAPSSAREARSRRDAPARAERTAIPMPEGGKVFGNLSMEKLAPLHGHEQSPFGAVENGLTFEGGYSTDARLKHAGKTAKYEIEQPLKPAEEASAQEEEAETERAPRNMSIDAIVVELSGGDAQWVSHTYSEFKATRRAYANHLQHPGKEKKHDGAALKLREAYIEARNSLLFVVARRMRPGAGFVPATEAEKRDEPKGRWAKFSMHDVLNAFQNEEKEKITDTDPTFDAVYGMLREPVLIEAFGPSIVEHGPYTGDAYAMLKSMLHPGTEQLAEALGDPESPEVLEFNKARLEYWSAFIRKMQKSENHSNKFNRSWFERTFPTFSFDKGRLGYEDRYNKSLSELERALRKGNFDEDTMASVHNELMRINRAEQDFENRIRSSSLDTEQRGMIAPLAGAMKKRPGWIRRMLLGAMATVGLTAIPENIDEPTTYQAEQNVQLEEGGLVGTEPEEVPLRFNAVPPVEVPRGQGAIVSFRRMLEQMPRGIRERMLSGMEVTSLTSDTRANDMALKLGFFNTLGESGVVGEGSEFLWIGGGERAGLWLDQKARGQIHFTDGDGKVLNRFSGPYR